MLWCYVHASLLSHVWIFAIPWTIAHQAPLCPWYFLSKNTGVVTHSFLQEIFPTQRLNPVLLHCRLILYHLSHEGNPCWVLMYLCLLYLLDVLTLLSLYNDLYVSVLYLLKSLSDITMDNSPPPFLLVSTCLEYLLLSFYVKPMSIFRAEMRVFLAAYGWILFFSFFGICSAAVWLLTGELNSFTFRIIIDI